MHFYSWSLAATLSAFLLSSASAHPLALNLATINLRPGLLTTKLRPNPQCSRRCPEPGDPRVQDENSVYLSESPESASVSDAYIFQGPDPDAQANCPNPLPITILFSVQEGHDCKKLARAYFDANHDAEFNCKAPAAQEVDLCGMTPTAPRFGELARNCYAWLVSTGHGYAASDVEPYANIVCAASG